MASHGCKTDLFAVDASMNVPPVMCMVFAPTSAPHRAAWRRIKEPLGRQAAPLPRADLGEFRPHSRARDRGPEMIRNKRSASAVSPPVGRLIGHEGETIWDTTNGMALTGAAHWNA